MPKISGNNNATYAEHTGVVTNAVGEQFELDPTKTLDGEDTPDLEFEGDRPDAAAVDSPDSTAPSANTDAAEQAERDRAEQDQNGNQDGERKRDGDFWDPATPNRDPHEKTEPAKTNEENQPRKSVPAKKAAPAADKNKQ